MGKNKNKFGGGRNDNRPNGKAWKKKYKIQGRKNKGTGGYSATLKTNA